MAAIFEQSTKQHPLHADASKLVRCEQIHSAIVRSVDSRHWGTVVPGCDGLVTRTPGTILAIRTADCFPVGIVDEARAVWGIGHAGWKGIYKGIVDSLVRAMAQLASRPESMRVWIGAGIGPCHFEVRSDVAQLFPQSVVQRDGKLWVDLEKEIERRLLARGIAKRKISVDQRCTYCNPELFYSHRRARGEPHEEMVSIISLV